MRPAGLAMLGAATYASALALVGGLQAQETAAEERCKVIMSVVAGVIQEYHGRISTDLISDLQRKVGTDGKCNGPDEYRVWPNTKDREALARIRRIISAWDICKRDPARKGCEPAGPR